MLPCPGSRCPRQPLQLHTVALVGMHIGRCCLTLDVLRAEAAPGGEQHAAVTTPGPGLDADGQQAPLAGVVLPVALARAHHHQGLQGHCFRVQGV